MDPRNFKDPEYLKWRKAVYARDKHMCQYPGCGIKKGLNAHHIKRWANYPTLRFFLPNGLTLCRAHHRMTFGKEEDFEQLFTEIVNKKSKNCDISRYLYTGENRLGI